MPDNPGSSILPLIDGIDNRDLEHHSRIMTQTNSSFDDGSDIRSERLCLLSLTPDVLDSLTEGEFATASHRTGLRFDDIWRESADVLRMRLVDINADPDFQPWSLRAIMRLSDRELVGHIGFHSRPGAAYLKDLSPQGVEFGYTVFPPYRRQGYAREASLALMVWARRRHGISHFVVSISPQNQASLALARQLGFRQIGSHIDETDGLEHIYQLTMGD